METTIETTSHSQQTQNETIESTCHHDDLHSELESLKESYENLLSKSSVMERTLLLVEQQRDEALNHNSDLKVAINEITRERDSCRDKVCEFEGQMREKEDDFEKELLRREEIEKELKFTRERVDSLEGEIEETKRRNEFLMKSLDLVRSVKDCLVKILECLDDEKVIEKEDSEEKIVEFELDDESRTIYNEVVSITRLASEAELKVNEFKEVKKKEKRELENSVVSLTEENRDINSLLRVALVEKELVEKKLKGNTEQKRVALLQIAERGLQRVGFGFMMGSGTTETAVEASVGSSSTTVASTTASTKSDSSECEEEVVSLASTVERIMKNLRLEITQLRRSLEESRSDTERLQNLTEQQAQQIAENTHYIKELEDRERVLAQNVEELLEELKETEAEVTRWREACELEVEAGKKEVDQRDKVVEILKQELEKTKADLDIANGKLKLKEELAAAAMAAQAASEKSLQIADSRATGFRERMEELTKQLEEAESKTRSQLKVRHICWPWKNLRVNAANNTNSRVQNARVRRMLPEMQALLHYVA